MTPPFNFKVDDSLAGWDISVQQWLKNHNTNFAGILSGVVVFNQDGRVLLIQRAGHDYVPDRWEIPGGSVGDDDETIISAAARELWEEAGLLVKRFKHFIPETEGSHVGHIFTDAGGTRAFCRFTFDVDVESCDAVQLDPDEHQDFVWADEEEVRQQKIGGRDIPLTFPTMQSLVLKAFRLRRSG